MRAQHRTAGREHHLLAREPAAARDGGRAGLQLALGRAPVDPVAVDGGGAELDDAADAGAPCLGEQVPGARHVDLVREGGVVADLRREVDDGVHAVADAVQGRGIGQVAHLALQPDGGVGDTVPGGRPAVDQQAQRGRRVPAVPGRPVPQDPAEFADRPAADEARPAGHQDGPGGAPHGLPASHSPRRPSAALRTPS